MAKKAAAKKSGAAVKKSDKEAEKGKGEHSGAAVGAPPLTEVQAENEAQEILVKLLRAAEDYGVSIEEVGWRKMAEADNNIAAAWINAKRTGLHPVLPLCLRPFASKELIAEMDAYLEKQQAGRKVLMPCIFGDAGHEKLADGSLRLKLPIKIHLSALREHGAVELFGETHCRIEVSKRPVAEWGQKHLSQDVEDDMRIIMFESDITRHSFCDSTYSIKVLCDESDFEGPEYVRSGLNEAISWGGIAGTIRIEVLGKTMSAKEAAAKAAESAPPVEKAPKPKKDGTVPAKKPEPPKLPNVDTLETFQVAKSENVVLVVNLCPTSDGRWQARWDGLRFAGAMKQSEASFRPSRVEAVAASIGNAVDFLDSSDEAEEKAAITIAKTWLAKLAANEDPAKIAKGLEPVIG